MDEIEEYLNRVYQNPYVYITAAIRRGRLCKALEKIAAVKDDRQWWELYIALRANASVDVSSLGSFEDFKARAISGVINTRCTERKADLAVSDDDMRIQIDKSKNVLKKFVPPSKIKGR